MLQVNEAQHRPSGRAPGGTSECDAPEGLRQLSDDAKARALAAGVTSIVGVHCDAQLDTVRYGAFDRSREFRRPAELRVTLFPREDADCKSVRLVRDVELEGALARSLGVAAMLAYADLQRCDVPAAERRRLEGQLLRYCELDTLAMVMVYEALRKWVRA